MATKKKETAKAKNEKKVTDEEKMAKRKARMEALKNRPAGQRQNSKQVDVIEGANGTCVKNFAHVVKVGRTTLGAIVTTVAYDSKGNIISASDCFVPGELTVKSKKGHGNFVKPKHKKEADEDEEEEETEEETDSNVED